jgi:alkanesulfonate monooxygenase SsuD/methylene tetrahydromethanopterin reductase-like flavin-dependent oxidoreductase (luciferase family)
MDIGIGLPATIPGVEREPLLEWARRAERRGFSTLGVIDRIVYPNLEPLTTLAAAAAVTERIRLTTAILIAPLRANAALLAKQAATIDRISAGRLVLGLAVGGREDDFEASGVGFHDRGRRFERQLDEMKRIWGDTAGAVGPRPAQAGGPELIIGGSVDAALDRAARHGNGWIMGGGAPDAFKGTADKFEQAWERAGRDGTPRKLALAYFALGDRAREHADSYLRDYYAFLGDFASQIAASAATGADTVRQYVDAFSAVGCDELILFPCATDPEQVDLLADAAGVG